MRGQQSIEISATPEHVYGVVSDLTRMGELSPECRRVEWLNGATGPTPGARFVGHDRGGPVTWSREGRVVAAKQGTEFCVRGPNGAANNSTTWTYRMTPTSERNNCDRVL